MEKHKKLGRFLLPTVIIYLFIYGVYLLTSVGLPDKAIYLQMRRYVPCAIAAGLAFYFWQSNNLPWRSLLPHALVGISWVLVFNFCYWQTYHLSTSFIDNYDDIAFGAYIFSATICLRLLLLSHCHNSVQENSDALLLGLIHTLLLIIPIFQIDYYLIYKSPITTAGAMAALQTNPNEAKEFIMQNFGSTGILSFLLLWLLIFYVFYRLNLLKQLQVQLSSKIILMLMVILLATGFYCHKVFYETGVMSKYLDAREYFDKSALFHQNHTKNYGTLEVIKPVQTFSKPSTIIMVIGESASMDFMSAYKPTEHDTTPWMKKMAATPDCILFRHAYTSWGQTVPALERALTEKNQYNDKEFNDAITIIDLAKKAGYTTYWFSNQGSISNADTPITMVAKTAGHSAWVEDTLANTKTMKYDEDLLPYLKQVDSTQNNFIIIHIMGSHDSYNNRYPPAFTKWGTPGKYEPVLDYDNSLAYTDKVLQDIFTYSKQNLNLQAFLYFSDHGADPLHRRHPDHAPFEGLRIPMFLYLSPEYGRLYPQTVATLHSHADTYFTNDLIYETMAGIFNITSNHYDETNSLASPKYKYTRDMLRTNLGKTKLTDDKD